jgi:hypothetical protein
MGITYPKINRIPKVEDNFFFLGEFAFSAKKKFFFLDYLKK